jgi:hypothetical protein
MFKGKYLRDLRCDWLPNTLVLPASETPLDWGLIPRLQPCASKIWSGVLKRVTSMLPTSDSAPPKPLPLGLDTWSSEERLKSAPLPVVPVVEPDGGGAAATTCCSPTNGKKAPAGGCLELKTSNLELVTEHCSCSDWSKFGCLPISSSIDILSFCKKGLRVWIMSTVVCLDAAAPQMMILSRRSMSIRSKT